MAKRKLRDPITTLPEGPATAFVGPSDILPDRVVDADHAGLGDGLDQAEEAQLGITDEQLKERLRRNPW